MAEERGSATVTKWNSSCFISTDADTEGNNQFKSSSDSAAVSIALDLLSRLRSPTPSDLARKIKIRQNPPPIGIKRGKGYVVANPKTIVPADHVKAHPDEHLLFCFREEVATKKIVMESHVKSQKHNLFMKDKRQQLSCRRL